MGDYMRNMLVLRVQDTLREIGPELLKRARPEPYLTPTGRTYGEDVA